MENYRISRNLKTSLTYTKDNEIESRLLADFAAGGVDCVDLRQRIGSASDAPDLPIYLTLDVENMKELLDPRELSRER